MGVQAIITYKLFVGRGGGGWDTLHSAPEHRLHHGSAERRREKRSQASTEQSSE